jgi:hypothetical protein
VVSHFDRGEGTTLRCLNHTHSPTFVTRRERLSLLKDFLYD